MPDYELSAISPKGKNSKLRIQASSFESAVRKAEKAGYAQVVKFNGDKVKTELIHKSPSVELGHATQTKSRVGLFSVLFSKAGLPVWIPVAITAILLSAVSDANGGVSGSRQGAKMAAKTAGGILGYGGVIFIGIVLISIGSYIFYRRFKALTN